ncbi:MAG: hypothetical protein L6R41_008366 [Letrouitia leprolyta]|nr:MAG: hypothetical protein L6R41_008366 [Letrouitia leprolyta]
MGLDILHGQTDIERPAGMLYDLTFSSHVFYFARRNDANNAKAFQLSEILKNLIQSLIPVLNELKGMGTASTPNASPAYRIFFKDVRNSAYIRNLLTRGVRGEPVCSPATPAQSWQLVSPQGNPIILVITERGQMASDTGSGILDMFDLCAKYRLSTGWTLYQAANPNPFIILCPFFFEAQPPYVKGDNPPAPMNGEPAPNCLSILYRTNNFRKVTGLDQYAGEELSQYRQWILLHLLVELYRTSDGRKSHAAVIDVNAAWKLNAIQALDNGYNYVYYAASESTFSTQLDTSYYPDYLVPFSVEL